MKKALELNGIFEEITSSDADQILGGVSVPVPLVLAAAVLTPVAALCAISYYVGYGIGRLTCGG